MVYSHVSGVDAVSRGQAMKILEQYHPSKVNRGEQTDLISVIVAAYNIEDYIERGVASICSQTYRNLEIIVVDDGSTDGTGILCDKTASKDERVHVIHKENGGLADARNVGLAQAKGSYIAFVDGDDWIDTGMYEEMLGALKDQHADMAVCRYRQVYRDYTEDRSVDRAVLFEGQEALQYYVQETEEYEIQNAAWNKLFRKELISGVMFPAGRWYEDIMFTTTALSRAKRCIYLDTAYYNYIIDREGSIMNSQINSRIFTDLIPTYYDKTRFLKELGRQDLADIHDYFFYKRLLLFYNRVEKTDVPERDRFLEQLTQIIRENKGNYARAFGCPVADPRDYRKMKMFLKSPARYRRRIRIEERVVIPLKVKVKEFLRK